MISKYSINVILQLFKILLKDFNCLVTRNLQHTSLHSVTACCYFFHINYFLRINPTVEFSLTFPSASMFHYCRIPLRALSFSGLVTLLEPQDFMKLAFRQSAPNNASPPSSYLTLPHPVSIYPPSSCP